MRDPETIAAATFEALLGVEDGQYADRALNEAGRRFRLQGDDRLETKLWLYRTLRWRARFDAALRQVGDPWLEPLCRAGGRLALSASFEGDGNPDLIQGLSQTLTARGRRHAAGLLNDLAPVARQIPLGSAGGSAEALADAYSHPEWLVAKLIEEYPDDAVKLLEAMNAEPPTTLRSNPLKITREALQERLATEGVITEPGIFSPFALHVTSRSDVFRTTAFQEGLFEMQDEGSQLLGWVLDPKPRGLIIDACAGAGGKSLLLAGMLKNRARILAVDIYENKLERLRERARRAGVDNIEARLVEPGGVSGSLLDSADAILVDAPCTGIGSLRRNPDAKWRLKESDISELSARQFGILLSWAQAVKKGGLLVYSTCTLSRQENREVVERFLTARPDFMIEPATIRFPDHAERFKTSEGYFACFPHRDGTDGFFAARLRRK